MSRTDLGSGAFVVDENTFARVAELEVRKAMRLQYPVSIVAIKPAPLPEGDTRPFMEQVAALVSHVIRETDLILVSPKSPTLYVLLVDALLSDIEVITARISEEVGRHPVAARGKSGRIRVSLGGACFPSTATTWQELVSQADRATPFPA